MFMTDNIKSYNNFYNNKNGLDDGLIFFYNGDNACIQQEPDSGKVTISFEGDARLEYCRDTIKETSIGSIDRHYNDFVFKDIKGGRIVCHPDTVFHPGILPTLSSVDFNEGNMRISHCGDENNYISVEKKGGEVVSYEKVADGETLELKDKSTGDNILLFYSGFLNALPFEEKREVRPGKLCAQI